MKSLCSQSSYWVKHLLFAFSPFLNTPTPNMDGPLKLRMPCGKMPSKFPKQHKNPRASYCEQESLIPGNLWALGIPREMQWREQSWDTGCSWALSQSLSTVRVSGVKAAFLSRQEGGGKYWWAGWWSLTHLDTSSDKKLWGLQGYSGSKN